MREYDPFRVDGHIYISDECYIPEVEMKTI